MNVSSTLDAQADRPCEAVRVLPDAAPNAAAFPVNVIDLRELFALVRQLHEYPPARPRRRWLRSSKTLLLDRYRSLY